MKIQIKHCSIITGIFLISFVIGCRDNGDDAIVTESLLSESSGVTLAKEKNCFACHAITSKLIGPAYKDVSAKYAGQKDAPDKIAKKVLKGGSGVWGTMPMPANPQVNQSEADKLVNWVLSQK